MSRSKYSATVPAPLPTLASANAASSGDSRRSIEVAPAPAAGRRNYEIGSSTPPCVFAKSGVGYTNLGTFEFLVDASNRPGAEPFVFIEANARLQVEHTVTEAVTGVDLVQTQIRLAQGATLREIGVGEGGGGDGLGDYAIQSAHQHGNDR